MAYIQAIDGAHICANVLIAYATWYPDMIEKNI